ncbi:hypothetical protein GQR58_022794 [Nymphon striatum]|nr:hypothetical protein GQR58_022794 [Nymphon striatum]
MGITLPRHLPVHSKVASLYLTQVVPLLISCKIICMVIMFVVGALHMTPRQANHHMQIGPMAPSLVHPPPGHSGPFNNVSSIITIYSKFENRQSLEQSLSRVCRPCLSDTA